MVESDKALRYIGLLDDARLHGKWDQIPELVRKVEKHAPHRKCIYTITTPFIALYSYNPFHCPFIPPYTDCLQPLSLLHHTTLY